MCLCIFFKQKTAYEMRISDWSSDVCSSDLRRLGLSRSAVQERVKRLERDGVIAGYTVTLGAEAPRAGVSAQVMLTLDPKFQDRAVDALRGLPEVKAAYTVSGQYDLMTAVTAAGAEAPDEELTRIGKLPGVTR